MAFSLHKLAKLAGAVAVMFVMSAMVGCHSSRSVSGASGRSVAVAKDGKQGGKQQPVRRELDLSGLDETTGSLLREAFSWQGVPYQWGGNTRDGVDCSGFVLQVYQKACGIALPRVSYQQYEYCEPTKRDKLEPGDLVFFATTRGSDRISHVGIYAGGGNMIHSSASRGVIVTDITQGYFSDHYAGAGRVARFYAMRDKNAKAKKERVEEKKPVKQKEKPKEKPKEKSKAQPKENPKEKPMAKSAQQKEDVQPAEPRQELSEQVSTPEAPKPQKVHKGVHKAQETAQSGASSPQDIEAMRRSVLSSLPDGE